MEHIETGITEIRDSVEREELVELESEYSAMWVTLPDAPKMSHREWQAQYMCEFTASGPPSRKEIIENLMVRTLAIEIVREYLKEHQPDAAFTDDELILYYRKFWLCENIKL